MTWKDRLLVGMLEKYAAFAMWAGALGRDIADCVKEVFRGRRS